MYSHRKKSNTRFLGSPEFKSVFTKWPSVDSAGEETNQLILTKFTIKI